MNNCDVYNSLADLYVMLNKHQIKSSANTESYNLTSENFIILGEASLVLQNKLDTTETIDILLTDNRNYTLKINIIETKQLPHKIMSSNCRKKDILHLEYNSQQFNIINTSASYGMVGDKFSKIKLNNYDTPLFVRPYQDIILDYENSLSNLKNIGFDKTNQDVIELKRKLEEIKK